VGFKVSMVGAACDRAAAALKSYVSALNMAITASPAMRSTWERGTGGGKMCVRRRTVDAVGVCVCLCVYTCMCVYMCS
jgi:hypothetical protein